MNRSALTMAEATDMYVEWQSKLERQLTPPALAAALVTEVRRLCGGRRVAALYVSISGPYLSLPGVDAWPLLAQYYPGPHPVICHPPCGPWGKLRWACKYQDASLGVTAIAQAHRWGGVVEQPLGSQLFRLHGRRGGWVTRIRQGEWGHPADKETLLYWALPR